MVMDFFRGATDTRLDEIEARIAQMLTDGRDVYDAAMSALFGGREPAEVKPEVKGVDRGINRAEREVRRMLMVHASVHGPQNLPAVLAFMSVVKDAERVGDYAKNIYDLARYGVDFRGAEDFEELVHYRDVVSRLIHQAAQVFAERDVDRASELIERADGFLDEYDAHVKQMFAFDGPPAEAVGRALYYRYLKRITAHVMNLLTSLVMPLDRLDYYDEDAEDRNET